MRRLARMPKAVTRWEPLDDVLDDLMVAPRRLRRLLADWRLGMRGVPTEAFETADEVVVRADLPGVDPKEVSVQFRSGELTISGKRVLEHPEGASLMHCDRAEGDFSIVMTIAAPIEESRIRAVHEHGVLTVRLPKREEARAKEIPIETVR
jgi:HSP20 family molecular chaperone IbpA